MPLSRQILVTISVLITTIILFDVTSIDLWVQDHLFDFGSQSWLISDNDRILDLIFYTGIKRVFFSAFILLGLILVICRKAIWMKRYRKTLLVVLLSMLAVPLAVGSLKSVTHMPCPKHLEHYGGKFPHVTLFTAYPASFHASRMPQCYPAGHASGAFSLFSLLFLFGGLWSRRIVLLAVMTIGWSVGIYKMMIGDHFLSHTLISMILAWLIILLIVRVIGRSDLVDNAKPVSKAYRYDKRFTASMETPVITYPSSSGSSQ
ncbi:MAG: hypothetical protein DHS20C01_30000 [marine bacterium B5-7]|nr:MAG: hypothetical protein DHS20C01_30000 [marine bacterium B5-7]